jgi:hypothetical protein
MATPAPMRPACTLCVPIQSIALAGSPLALSTIPPIPLRLSSLADGSLALMGAGGGASGGVCDCPVARAGGDCWVATGTGCAAGIGSAGAGCSTGAGDSGRLAATGTGSTGGGTGPSVSSHQQGEQGSKRAGSGDADMANTVSERMEMLLRCRLDWMERN